MTQNTKNIADIGCGTSVLSLIMSQYQLPRIYAIDNNENSIVSTKSNAQASDVKTTDNNDPLKNFKKESKIILNELKKKLQEKNNEIIERAFHNCENEIKNEKFDII